MTHAPNDRAGGPSEAVAPKAIRPTERPTERLLSGEGEELVRQTLEDGVIARERDPHHRVGWTIADIAHDLGVSEERARKLVRKNGGANLRAGQAT